ncbi:hypothetical protein ACFO25_01575 [Paenactinomyces guangxiensis]|uniref:Uncharacterized protein n=1 Tax=Paenactinomyces guangxiensis TaxID=1490290 RepID=A0A7W2A8U2_9BACL|nr:hypothetical protein [Paenactinomyces guangxiensis]MBA4495931.1 hypothetical protein [Paenactinomyces guangxiensis]MBH8593082.1 hypothetical protein [Paenactinomyces guangxiensis]
MIKIINVIINEDSLKMTSLESITGDIYFAVGDEYFPEPDWLDFPVVILTWWCQEILALTTYSEKCKFLFMDGPLLARGTKKGNDIIELEFVQERLNGDEKLFTATCSIKQFKKSLLRASKKLLRAIEEKKWDTPDVQELKRVTSLMS